MQRVREVLKNMRAAKKKGDLTMRDYNWIKNGTSEEDYVERNGEAEELTVEITLCEYRRLIRAEVQQAAEIGRLLLENEKLCEKTAMLSDAVFVNHPELFENIAAAAKEIFEGGGHEESEEA